MNILTFLAKRFVAGETASEAIEVVKRLNNEGIKVSLDILGENVYSKKEALLARDAYLNLLDLIDKTKVDSYISIKLTQLGLDIDQNFCQENVLEIVKSANEIGTFVRIDMEGSDYTERTLDIYYSTLKEYNNIGIVIQAMLYRSFKDVEKICRLKNGNVRLCKGAYKEPITIAFPDKRQTNLNYIRLMTYIFNSGTYLAIATHDEKMISEAINQIIEKKIPKDKFEFQMLYGIRRDLWKEIVKAGYTMRVYVPFGTHWLPYFSRRIRERKENFFFVLKNLFR